MRNQILTGDALIVLKSLPANCLDSIVCDCFAKEQSQSHATLRTCGIHGKGTQHCRWYSHHWGFQKNLPALCGEHQVHDEACAYPSRNADKCSCRVFLWLALVPANLDHNSQDSRLAMPDCSYPCDMHCNSRESKKHNLSCFYVATPTNQNSSGSLNTSGSLSYPVSFFCWDHAKMPIAQPYLLACIYTDRSRRALLPLSSDQHSGMHENKTPSHVSIWQTAQATSILLCRKRRNDTPLLSFALQCGWRKNRSDYRSFVCHVLVVWDRPYKSSHSLDINVQ